MAPRTTILPQHLQNRTMTFCRLREMTHPTEIGTTTFRFETSPHGRLRLHEWSAPAHGLGTLLCGSAKDRDLRRVQYAGRVRRSRQGTTVRSIWSVWVSDLHGPGAIATAAKSKSSTSRRSQPSCPPSCRQAIASMQAFGKAISPSRRTKLAVRDRGRMLSAARRLGRAALRISRVPQIPHC